MKSNIKFINVEDIEDIITAKIYIDNINKEKSDLDKFIDTYCLIDNMYSNNGLNLFFKLFIIENNLYIFYLDDSHKLLEKFKNKLEKLNYNLDTLNYSDIGDETIVTNKSEYFIINNKYVKL